jgi:radical SAM protein with 4Fe4S-binding SPASM domain
VLRPEDGLPWENYLRVNEEMRGGRTELSALPPFLRIEVTTRCNLDCVHCWIAGYRHADRDLPLAVLERIAEELIPTAASVQYTDLGEPLLYKHLDRVLRLLRQAGTPYTKLFSNGLVLSESLVRRLIESGLRELALSVDGAQAETFETIRRGGRFARLLRNLELLSEVKASLGSELPVLTFNVVAMVWNLGELEEIVELAARYGARGIYIYRMFATTEQLAALSAEQMPEATEEALQRARERAAALGLSFSTDLERVSPAPECTEAVDERLYRGELEVLEPPRRVPRDSHVHFRLRLRNDSPFTWFSSRRPTETCRVNVAYHLFDAAGRLLLWDGLRTPLPRNVPPGGELELSVQVKIPDSSGELVIAFDLVNEDVRWFELEQRLRVKVADEILLRATPENYTFCEFPWKYASIKVNGDVHPCRFLSISMGNLKEQSFARIWNSPRYQRLRRSILDGSYDLCRGAGCVFTMGSQSGLRAEIEVLEAPARCMAGKRFNVRVQVTNRGDAVWNAEGSDEDPTHYDLSHHILDAEGGVLLYDGYKAPLPRDLPPGESAEVLLPVRAPERPGEYVVNIDVVREHVIWFGSLGSPTCRLPITVMPRRNSLASRLIQRAASAILHLLR